MFAKIYVSEKVGQILITKEYDTEEKNYLINLTFENENCLIKIGIGSEKEESQIKAFEELNAQRAEEVIMEIISTF